MQRWPGIVAIVAGLASIPLSVLGAALGYGAYTLVVMNEVHGNEAVLVGSAALTLVLLAIPIGLWRLRVFSKAEEAAGRPRGLGAVTTGLVMTAIGPVMLVSGFVLFAVAAIVGVIGLWLSSLV